MAIFDSLENVLGLKALAWDYEQGCFVSPQQNKFTWSRGGLVQGTCSKNSSHKYPEENCICGLYATFSKNILYEYLYRSPLSPVFLVEASGITIIHENGYRSEEMTIKGVSPVDTETVGIATANLAAWQASEYFGLGKPISIDVAFRVMDLWNKAHLKWYEGVTDEVMNMPRQKVLELLASYGIININ